MPHVAAPSWGYNQATRLPQCEDRSGSEWKCGFRGGVGGVTFHVLKPSFPLSIPQLQA